MTTETTESKCKLFEGDIVPPTRADREAMSTVALVTREENAKQIGELQARVSELEGEGQAREMRVLFLMGAVSDAQRGIIRLQGYEMARTQERIDAGGKLGETVT